MQGRNLHDGEAGSLVVGIVLIILVFLAPAARAEGGDQPQAPQRTGPADWLVWNGDNFFHTCTGDCSATLFVGRQIVTPLTNMLFIDSPGKYPWQGRWGGAEFVGGEVSRRLITFWDLLSIDPEIGAGKRFGTMSAGEFWGALSFRWHLFPWNEHLKTTFAISDGISVVTKVDRREQALNNADRPGSAVLNYLSPEMTFALPEFADYELVLKLQHRSGVWGTIHGVYGAAQFGTIGFRVHF